MGTELKYITLVVVNSELMPVEVAVALRDFLLLQLNWFSLTHHTAVAACGGHVHLSAVSLSSILSLRSSLS